MSASPMMRVLEWVAALVGAANCVIVPLLFAQPGGRDFPLPGLYFIEIVAVGVLVAIFVALRPRLSPRWNAIPWIAAGIILTFVILGGFSIGLYLIPAAIAFAVTGFSLTRKRWGCAPHIWAFCS
ncbi:MAG TPA: hypothetical protein PKE20_03070 [Promineifilum sp.]|nr:hypothetical protein [Promineifilum sp.]